jgi:hypothetical protein
LEDISISTISTVHSSCSQLHAGPISSSGNARSFGDGGAGIHGHRQCSHPGGGYLSRVSRRKPKPTTRLEPTRAGFWRSVGSRADPEPSRPGSRLSRLGSKPYLYPKDLGAVFLRGSDCGLSWEKGLLMDKEKVADGYKYSLSVSCAAITTPLEVKVLIADERWMLGPNFFIPLADGRVGCMSYEQLLLVGRRGLPA